MPRINKQSESFKALQKRIKELDKQRARRKRSLWKAALFTAVQALIFLGIILIFVLVVYFTL